MYTEEKLKNSDYFSDILKVNKIEYVVDSLTGLINRKYMLEYIKHLIDNNIPFSMAIVDLDDFKSVNDKYGHATGDYVLEHVTNDLINFVGDIGLVGRFGGDEFIIVLFGKNSYDLLHDYFDELEPNSLIDLRVRHFFNFLRKNCLKMLNNTAYVNDFSQSIY